MAANASSSWPTTRVQRGGYTRDRGDPAKARPSLEGAAANWMTPQAADAGTSGPLRPKTGHERDLTLLGNWRADLKDQAAQWRTPQCGDATRGSTSKRGASSEYQDKAGKHSLVTEVALWSTPNAHDGHRPGPDLFSTQGRNLSREAANWPSPTARMWRGGGQAVTRADGKSRLDMLDWAAEAWRAPASLHPDLPIPAGQTSLQPIPFAPLPSDGSISGPLHDAMQDFRRWSMRSGGAAGWRGTWMRTPRRALNPRFVELLMRWPIGWSGFGSLETGLTPWLAGMRTFISTLDTARAESVTQPTLL